MNKNSSIDEIRRELAILQMKHETLEKSYRRLVVKVLGDTPEAQQFLGQIAVDRVEFYPNWLK
jgi:hypothetical protein